jgi:hypothetical protein
MEELIRTIEDLTSILSALTPESMTPERIAETDSSLSALDTAGAIERFSFRLPVRPEDEEAADAYDEGMRETVDAVNRSVSAARRELERIREWRATLDLEALDGVIALARGHVRSLYDFTSSLQG